MVNLQFLIDKEDDINLWLSFLNNKRKSNNFGHDRLDGLTKEFLDKVLDKPEDIQRKVISEEVEQYYTEKNLTKFKVESYNKIKDKLDQIIERLEKLHNRKLPVDNIIVKYETFTCCPYIWQGKESDTFGLYFATYVLDQDSQIKVFCHEVMHLFFHYYFFDDCVKKGLTDSQTQDLKEAVTALLNYEFEDIIDKKDYGHKGHKDLRKLISEEWQKMPEKNFEKLLDLVIEKIK
jgi:hypothetical protein